MNPQVEYIRELLQLRDIFENNLFDENGKCDDIYLDGLINVQKTFNIAYGQVPTKIGVDK